MYEVEEVKHWMGNTTEEKGGKTLKGEEGINMEISMMRTEVNGW